MFGGETTQELDAEAAARARARYQHYVRLGMLLCLILLLMDSSPQPPPSSASSHLNHLNTLTVNSVDAKLLNQALPSHGTHSVPRNISGLFRGYWSMSPHTNETVKELKGNVLLQVKSLAIENMPNLHYLYGFLKLYSVPKLTAPRTFEDILYPIQGIYILSTGESTLVTTPSLSHRVFLVIPLSTPNKTSTSSGTLTAAPRRLFADLPDRATTEAEIEVESSRELFLPRGESVFNGIAGSLEDNLNYLTADAHLRSAFSFFSPPPEEGLVGSIHPSKHRFLREKSSKEAKSQSESHAPSAAASSTSPPQQQNSSASISISVKQTGKSRIVPGDIFKLVTESGEAQMERFRVGSSGLELLLVTSQPAKGTSKSAAPLVPFSNGGFGYDSLPANFKMFQQSHGASRGYQQSSKCNFALKTQSSDMEVASHHEKPKALNGTLAHEDAYIFDELDSSLILKDHHPSIKTFQSQIRGKSVLNGPDHCKNEYLSFDMSGVYYKINLDIVESKILHYALFYSAVCGLQIYLLWKQMQHSSTPAGAGKVSVLCISSQAVLDAGICIVHLLSSSSVAGVAFYLLLSISFMKLIIFCILEMRLVIGIYQSRYAQDMAVAGWQGLRNHLATLHARFYAALFAVILLVDFFFDNPVVIVFGLYSFWVPQILYSAYSGGRKPLDRTYVLGVSASRLLFPLYVFACPHNVYHVLTERSTFSLSASLALILWLAIQVTLLLLQDRFGPRFFVPAQFLPVRYNYFRPIPSNRAAANGSDTESGEADGGECVICYTPVAESERNYMITPCDHLFHQECLSRWLEVKLECPVCRAHLPPADD